VRKAAAACSSTGILLPFPHVSFSFTSVLHVASILSRFHPYRPSLVAISLTHDSLRQPRSMPLEDVSVNIQRPTKPSREKSDNNDKPSPAAPPPPRAVQSMLKTTTELGDLGQLGNRTSRLSHSGSRIHSSRARSGSFDASFASALRHERSPYIRHPSHRNGPRPTHSASTLSGHGSRSNLSSYSRSTRPRRYPPRHHPYPVHSLTSPSPSLYTHRSLATLRSNRDINSVRSASPVGPHHRLRGVPYRASSPSIADDGSINTPYPDFMRAPSVGTVASSPRSVYQRQGPYPSYRPDLSGSSTSLQRIPSPAYPYPYAQPYPSRVFSVNQTPVSSYRATAPFSVSATFLAGIPQSPSGSTTPAYYDYSESFEGHGYPGRDAETATASAPTFNQVILEDVPTPFHRQAQTPFGIRDGSKFQPVELPTKHNRRLSENTGHSVKPGSRHSTKRSVDGIATKPTQTLNRPTTSGGPTRTVCGFPKQATLS
jgi:hypothetical protein